MPPEFADAAAGGDGVDRHQGHVPDPSQHRPPGTGREVLHVSAELDELAGGPSQQQPDEREHGGGVDLALACVERGEGVGDDLHHARAIGRGQLRHRLGTEPVVEPGTQEHLAVDQRRTRHGRERVVGERPVEEASPRVGPEDEPLAGPLGPLELRLEHPFRLLLHVRERLVRRKLVHDRQRLDGGRLTEEGGGAQRLEPHPRTPVSRSPKHDAERVAQAIRDRGDDAHPGGP